MSWQLQQESTLLRQEAVVERCVRRMKQMTHARIFGRWYEAVQEVKAMRVKVAKVLTRWKAAELAGIFDKWLSWTNARSLCRRIMNKLLRQLATDAQERGLATWKAFVSSQVCY